MKRLDTMAVPYKRMSPPAGAPIKTLMVDSLVGNDYAVYLCKALRQAGVHIVLVVPENKQFSVPVDFPVLRWSPAKGGRKTRTGKISEYFLYMFRLVSYVRRTPGALVHFQFFRRERIESLFYCLLRVLGANLVYTAHNVFPHDRRRIDFFLKMCVYKCSHRIIAHSDFIKRQLITHFNIRDAAIEIIPHGNFDAHLPAESVTVKQAREYLSLGDNDHVMLFFGIIRENKGLELLLDAFELASVHDAQLKLLIAGEPQSLELDRSFRSRISQIEASGRIVYHPRFVPLNAVPYYFTAADIVVLPYRTIYHSGVLHAAFSFARPVITTNVGDFKEMVTDGLNGWVLGQNTAVQLAAAIGKAFKSRSHLRRMGLYARKISEKKFSWTDIAQKTKALYAATQSSYHAPGIFRLRSDSKPDASLRSR
jgi:glycosyltransferase involved in cell wall biosynthesis